MIGLRNLVHLSTFLPIADQKTYTAHLCTLIGISYSPQTAYSPWTNGFVEVQNRKLGTHLRMFLHNTPQDWAFQVHMYAYAHNSQPLSELNVSPYEVVFHTRPGIPLTFDLKLNRNTSKLCISTYCSQLPELSHFDKRDLYPFCNKSLSKPNPQWFLAVETAMLQIHSTVYEHTLKKLTLTRLSQKPIMKVNHFLLAPLYSNVFFLTFIFLTNSNRFGLAHTKSSTDSLSLHMNFSHKMVPHYTFIETTQNLIFQKNHFCTLIFAISFAFQTQPIIAFQNRLNTQKFLPFYFR